MEKLNSEIIDLKIQNLEKDKIILRLRRQVKELESSREERFGPVRMNVVDVATVQLTGNHSAAGSEDQKTTFVTIDPPKHTGSFNFKKRSVLIKDTLEGVIDVFDEMRKRNCLAKTIREKCGQIAKNVPVQAGLFLDQLISAGCLDDEEGKIVSETRKAETNQMRAIIVIVLKKDFKTILCLVSCIKEINRDLGEDILRRYNELVTSGHGREEKCWQCLMKDRVKFAIIIDKLLSEELIDDELYDLASREDMSPEQKQQVWTAVLLRITENASKTMRCLREAISDSEVHHDICTLIGMDIDKGCCSLRCKCGPQMQELKVSEFEKSKDCDSGVDQVTN